MIPFYSLYRQGAPHLSARSSFGVRGGGGRDQVRQSPLNTRSGRITRFAWAPEEQEEEEEEREQWINGGDQWDRWMNGHTNECGGESIRMYYREHGPVVKGVGGWRQRKKNGDYGRDFKNNVWQCQ